MARIDWKNLPDGIIGYDLIPEHPDWTDPTHAPLMVAAVVADSGNDGNVFPDDDLDILHTVAIDNIPNGEAAVREAVKKRLYEMAEEGGWSDYLIDPVTGKYPFDAEDD